MFLASKYEEIYALIVEYFVLVFDNAYRKFKILHMETSSLNTLQFNITVRTPYIFTMRVLKEARSEKYISLVILIRVEYIMLKYPPSMLATATMYTTLFILIRAPSWSRTMECHTIYTKKQLIECAKLMTGFHQNDVQNL
ncbi:hypothetical protein SUGI_1040320 [Cryptomeria japonica]|nr:hypothetical protein SUGI_1040320 [Cryptomeria japonica]